MLRVRGIGMCSFAVGGTLRRAIRPSLGGRRGGNGKWVVEVGLCDPPNEILRERDGIIRVIIL